jgi:hypothetical protein
VWLRSAWGSVAVCTSLLVAACSASVSVEAQPTVAVAVPTAPVTPTVEAPTATPNPTPTPHPRVDEVVDAQAAASGRFELTMSTNQAASTSFAGVFDDVGESIELAFEFEDFLVLAGLADPSPTTDPLTSQAVEVLAGTWTVRVVAGSAYVQQAVLVAAAGGNEGEWLRVDDPAIAEVLATNGALGGGLNHGVVVEIVRIAGGETVAVGSDEIMGDDVSRFDFILDGSELTPEVAERFGAVALREVRTPSTVWVDRNGVLRRVRFEVPAGGFGEGTESVTLDVTYFDLGEVVELGVPLELVDVSG